MQENKNKKDGGGRKRMKEAMMKDNLTRRDDCGKRKRGKIG